MYDALTIALYVINQSCNLGYPVSNLKLQKVLYFIQGYFLAIRKRACFNERIEAWSYGPVVPSIYREFKTFGSNNIPKQILVDDFGKNIDESEMITEDDRVIIDAVLNLLRGYSATSLIEITHDQKPWKTAIENGRNSEITQESIMLYFREKIN